MATTIRPDGGDPTITIIIGNAQKGRYSSDVMLSDGTSIEVGTGRNDDGLEDTHRIGRAADLNDALLDWTIFSDSPGDGSDPGHVATVIVRQDAKVLHVRTYDATAPRPYFGIERLRYS